MPPLNALRAFEAAARHESFAKAADELGNTRMLFVHEMNVGFAGGVRLHVVGRPRGYRKQQRNQRTNRDDQHRRPERGNPLRPRHQIYAKHHHHPLPGQNTKGCGPNKGIKAADSGLARRLALRDFAATSVDVLAPHCRLKLTNRTRHGALVGETQLTRAGSIVIGRPDPMFLPRGV